MKKENKWENFYKKTPLEKIFWQKSQDDYLKEVINSRTIKLGSVLDLGCGTGIKSVFLAKKGFNVVGIDISKTAIGYADENAKKNRVDVEFFVADATNLKFLENRKFDFILDWANLHGIEKNKREQYISEIISHTKAGSKLLLRCFGKGREIKKEFVNRPMGKIYLFSEEDVRNLYEKYFKIINVNKNNKIDDKAPSKFFYEFLMERI